MTSRAAANVKSKPELNGKSARVIQLDAEKNRFLVQVLSETKEGEKISLKQKCLVVKKMSGKDDGEKDVKVEEKEVKRQKVDDDDDDEERVGAGGEEKESKKKIQKDATKKKMMKSTWRPR